jgi:type IV pilus assembly protein PilB
MLSNKVVQKILLDDEKLTKTEKKRFKKTSRSEHTPLEELLISEHALTEDEIYERAAAILDHPFMSFKEKLVNSDALELLDYSYARKHHVAVVGKKSGSIVLATSVELAKDLHKEISEKLKKPITLVITDPTSLDSLHAQYRKDIDIELKKIHLYSDELDITNIFEAVMERAIRENASDVHVEPTLNETIIRYRVDGVMRRIAVIPKALHSAILARIKVVSNLRVDEHRLPQDGRYSMVGPDYKVSVRVSIMSLDEGEKAVMRILPERQKFFSLEELGFNASHQKIIDEQMHKRQGLILVVGPTGSGKTTTLYTLINILNSEKINISTIEDPIEYSVQGINQSQVKPQIGLTFSIGLRAFLRQDPDAIMVGEIRDKETGEISLRAALTGHLVMSTLHTNDASRTLPRLTQMGIERYLLPPTINMIIAQRLARRVCDACSKKSKITKELTVSIEEILKVPFSSFLKSKGLTKKDINVRIPKGCKKCDNSGYKGRLGIYEILENSPELQTAILVGSFAKQINDLAVRNGMVPMLEDGVLKVLNGQTSIEELMRVM